MPDPDWNAIEMQSKIEAGRQVLKHLPPLTATRSLEDRAWLTSFNHLSLLRPSFRGKRLYNAEKSSTLLGKPVKTGISVNATCSLIAASSAAEFMYEDQKRPDVCGKQPTGKDGMPIGVHMTRTIPK